ncbi:MAG: hypothetical protein WCR20_15685 [Verrucomicrobiota bacterium]
MEYEVMVMDPMQLVFNIKKEGIYKSNGGNMLSGLVLETRYLGEDYPKTLKEQVDFFDFHFLGMLDSVLCFSDELMKTFVKKYDIKHKDTSDEHRIDFRKNNKRLMKKLTGIKLLVKQIEIIDWRDDEPEEDYDTINDLFNPLYYDPDDWEFVLKVIKVL